MTNTASRTKPTVATAPLDLQTRVENRKRELIAEIIEHKKSSRLGAADAIEQIKDRLTELARIVKVRVVDGWANLGDAAKHELDDWIAR